MESILLSRLATLSHPQRMAVFQLLMRRYPDALPAGEICAALDLKPSTASAYLSALQSADLILQTREGTKLLYRINMDAARAVVNDLFQDCCRGRPDMCPRDEPSDNIGATAIADRPLNVLFVCSGNSTRSIMAESILRHVAPDHLIAHSAGTSPRDKVDPAALEILELAGHDIAGLHPKPLEKFQTPGSPHMDIVLTVCDRAANEECNGWRSQTISGHWGVASPDKSDPERQDYRDIYKVLLHMILDLVALPFAQLSPAALQKQIDLIPQSRPDMKDLT